MSTSSGPRAPRRTILRLLAGSIAASGLGRLGAAAAAAAVDPKVKTGDAVLSIEFDSFLRSRLIAHHEGAAVPLTDFEASETLRLNGKDILHFALVDTHTDAVEDRHGRGTRYVVHGRSAERIEKRVTVVSYERYPGFAFLSASYRNSGRDDVWVDGWVNGAHVLQPLQSGSMDYWSFSGASYVDRRDWVQPVHEGFEQRNFMGMNATDYGGGTPVVDIWRRDFGIAVGHLETVPKLIALPLSASKAGARIAVEFDQRSRLRADEDVSTFDTFVAVHRGDFFAVLDTYRKVLAERGMPQAKVPLAAYEPVWCGWGYEHDFTVDQVLGTLPKASELGLIWAVLDDGWQTSLGDWYLDPQKFPRGDADMVALVKAIRRAGMRPRLWIAPLAAHPGSDVRRDHPDLLLLNKSGEPQDVTGWDSLYLCPAYSPTIERTKALIRKVMVDWGYDGLKIDGQHLNAVAPCYNPAHKHARPEESVEKLQEFYKGIFDLATALKPDGVVEICPCGTSYAFHIMPYMHQAVGSDPLSSWQVRHKGKAIKALMGASAAYAGDHVELSDGGNDFASTVGIGAVVSTKFTWPRDAKPEYGFVLTPEKEVEWRRWIALYKDKRLPEGRYVGGLYDIGFDLPETHAIRKDGKMYYSFFAKTFGGKVELRGLDKRKYRIRDYVNGQDLGTVNGPVATLDVSFLKHLLVEATPE